MIASAQISVYPLRSGVIRRDMLLTPEILSRADRNLFDPIIALATGATHAVAVLSPKMARQSSASPSRPLWCRGARGRQLRVSFVEVVIMTPQGPTLGGDEDEQ